MDLFGRLMELQNRLAAPLAPLFMGQGSSCPLSVTFGRHFASYAPLWLLLLLLLWAAVHFCFARFTHALMRRMGLSRVRVRRASRSAWEAGVSAGAALLCASQLEAVGPQAASASTAEWPPPHVAMYVAVVAACQAEALLARLRARDFGSEVLVEVTRVVVPLAAYSARWADLGFLFCLHTSVVQVLLQMCRLVLSLRKGLHHVVLGLFCALALCWCICYCCFVPFWIQSVLGSAAAEEFGLISLLAALCLHAFFALVYSPLLIGLMGLGRRAPLTEWLELSLFPNTDLRLTKLRKDIISEEQLSRKNSLKRADEKVDQGKALVQIIRCSSLLRRKVKAMRQRKLSSSESSQEAISREDD